MTWQGLNPPYSTIVADPPWTYPTTAPGWRVGDERRGLPYSTMTDDEVENMPVAGLASPGAHLYLWATNFKLETAFRVCRSWGFSPTTTLVWCKAPRGLGPAGRFTVTTEFAIFAVAPSEKPPKREVARAGELIRTARETAGIGMTQLHHMVRGGTPTGLVYRWEHDESLPSERDWRRLQEVLPDLAGVDRPEVPPPPEREAREVARVESTWFAWPRTHHSEKPAAFLDVVEHVSDGPLLNCSPVGSVSAGIRGVMDMRVLDETRHDGQRGPLLRPS